MFFVTKTKLVGLNYSTDNHLPLLHVHQCIELHHRPFAMDHAVQRALAFDSFFFFILFEHWVLKVCINRA